MIKSAAQSSILNDTRYTSMSAGVMPSSEYLISTTLISSNTPNVTFDVSSFAGVYKHLQLVVVARSDRAETGDNILLRFNGDSNFSSYYYHALFGTGSIAGSENVQGAGFPGARFMQASSATFTANAFNVGICDIIDAYGSKNKTIRTFSGLPGTYDRIWLASNLWNSTAPITSITLVSNNGANFVAGSRFSLYGVTA
jgi:hypothetical protein